MKIAIRCTLALVGIAALCLVIVAACYHHYENVVPQEEDLKRYPYLQVFTQDYTEFKGVKHDLDAGPYVFSIKPSVTSMQTYWNNTIIDAAREGWTLDLNEGTKKIFSKKIEIHALANKEVVEVERVNGGERVLISVRVGHVNE